MVSQHMDILPFVVRVDLHPPDQLDPQMPEVDGPGRPVVGLDVVVVGDGNGGNAGHPGLGNDFSGV